MFDEILIFTECKVTRRISLTLEILDLYTGASPLFIYKLSNDCCIELLESPLKVLLPSADRLTIVIGTIALLYFDSLISIRVDLASSEEIFDRCSVGAAELVLLPPLVIALLELASLVLLSPLLKLYAKSEVFGLFTGCFY
jgi:hypothetical protein